MPLYYLIQDKIMCFLLSAHEVLDDVIEVHTSSSAHTIFMDLQNKMGIGV